MKRELVIVMDFGGQYNQLVARRVRECNVYCEIYSYKTDIEKIKEMNPKGIILTGGISYDKYVDAELTRKLKFIAPVTVMAGEFEMEALAAGAIRVLSGEEQPKEYTGIPCWNGFDFDK